MIGQPIDPLLPAVSVQRFDRLDDLRVHLLAPIERDTGGRNLARQSVFEPELRLPVCQRLVHQVRSLKLTQYAQQGHDLVSGDLPEQFKRHRHTHDRCRIEDSFLLTDTGLRDLSAKVPKSIEDVERLLAAPGGR